VDDVPIRNFRRVAFNNGQSDINGISKKDPRKRTRKHSANIIL
jgi:hypothetical protein